VDGTEDTVAIEVGLNNTGDVDVTVVSTSLAFDSTDDEKLSDLGIKVGVIPDALESNDWTIRAGEHIDGAISLSITWNHTLGIGHTADIEGRVVVQGSAIYKSPDSWHRELRSDPRLDSNMTAEIPVIVHLAQGRIALAFVGSTSPFSDLFVFEHGPKSLDTIEAAFFPRDQSDFIALSTGPEDDVSGFKSIDHHIRAYSTTNLSVALASVEVFGEEETLVNDTASSLCNRLQVSTTQSLGATLDEGISDLGLIYLKYEFPHIGYLSKNVQTDNSLTLYPTKCSLRFSTWPESGTHSLPLLVYSGSVEVSVGGLDAITESPLPTRPPFRHNRVGSLMGFPKMLDWFQNSKAGSSLRSLLTSKRTENDEVLLARYMYGLAKTSINLESSTLRPILLKVGAINPDEIEVLPIFVTNHNPVAARLKIDVPEVEGISITLGRDPVQRQARSLLDQIAPSTTYWKHGRRMAETGPFKNQPVAALDQFLRSDPTARTTLSFGFRDAIEMSDKAVLVTPLLKELYRSKPDVEYHKSKTDNFIGLSKSCGELEGSQSYSSFMSNLRGRKYPGPVTISPESKSVRALRQCTNRTGKLESVSPEISVPPGAVARFDVKLRSPPLSALDHDINQFLSTGLVLSTEYGEVLPVFVAFETPRGKLDVSPMLGADGYETISQQGVRSVRVPPGLFGKHTPRSDTAVVIPPKSRSFDGVVSGDIMTVNPSAKDTGASLYMKSSFNRPVDLLEVSSCNPWFEVALHNGSSPPASDPLLGVNVGSIKSVVSCDFSRGSNKTGVDYPSFFGCAFNWVLERPELQPQGCGHFSGFDEKGRNLQTTDRLERSQALRVLNRAVTLSQWSLGRNRMGRKRRAADGQVSIALLSAVADAWNIWRTAPDSSLLRLSTSLRAEIRYNAVQSELSGHHDSGIHHLSLAMGNLTVDSVLELPILGNKKKNSEHGPMTIDFPRTLVGDVSSRMIPVSNPTAVPIRVRLAVSPGKERISAYRGSDQFKASSSARKAFLGSYEPPYTQSGNNIQSSIEFVSEQWWDGGGSYFMADVFGGLVRSSYNITIRAGSGALVSLLNPGLLSNVAFTNGCGLRCGLKDEAVKIDGPHDVRSTSFLGAAAAEQTVLMGQQRSPPGEQSRLASGKGMLFEAAGSMLTGGKGPAAFSIPFFSLDKEIEIPPFGKAELGPVWFRPPGTTKNMGCESVNGMALPEHCQKDNSFKSMLFVENSLTGLERGVVQGKGMWKRVVFHDGADDGLDGAYSDIEVRNGRDALIFSGSAESNSHGSGESKQIFLSNVGDAHVTFKPPFLVDTAALRKASVHGERRSCSLGEFSFVPCSKSNAPIELGPGENTSFFIHHEPRCVQSSMFVALVFEYYGDDKSGPNGYNDSRPRRSPFQKSREELLVGYKMDAFAKARCVPSSGHVVLNFIDALHSVGLNRPERNIFKGSGMLAILAFALTYILIILSMSASGLILLKKLYSRQAKSYAFHARLLGGSQKKNSVLNLGSNWLSTLRCLSRLDPSSQDLQTLGREQTRQVLLNQFRTHGVLTPLCLNASGLFQRERSSGVLRSRSHLSSSGGADRIRTLSDAIFKQTKPCFSAQGVLTSYGAGWKMALARGIINDSSLKIFGVNLSTEKLLVSRAENPTARADKRRDITAGDGDDEEKPAERPLFEENSDGDSRGRGKDTGADEPSGDEEEEEDESIDEGEVENVVDEAPRVGKVIVLEVKPENPMQENESAEFMTVTSKGKPSRKNAKGTKVVNVRSQKKDEASNRTTPAETPGNISGLNAAPKAQSVGQTTSKSVPKRCKRKGKGANGDLSKAEEVVPNPPSSQATKKTGKGSKGKAQKQKTSKGPTTTTDAPKPSESSLRPPPGLAPPPGFEGSAVPPSTKPALPLSESPAQSQSVLPGVIQPSSPHIAGVIPEGAGLSSESIKIMGAATPTNISIGGSPLLAPGGSTPELNLPQTEDGFDIMDFLDGILNEGVATPVTEPPAGNQESADVASPSLLLVPSSNPWADTATEEPRSRATNYGINFEDGDTNERETALSVDIPMLTPETILGQPTAASMSDELDGDDTDFYSSLLK